MPTYRIRAIGSVVKLARHSRENGNPEAISANRESVIYRILDSRFRVNDEYQRPGDHFSKLTTRPREAGLLHKAAHEPPK